MMKRNLKRKLRARFVVLTMLSLFLVQSVIVGVSIYHNYKDLTAKSDMLIAQLHKNPSGAGRYFSVKIPVGTDTVYPDAVRHVSVSAEEAADFAHRALSQDRERGFLDGYRYRIYRNENGTRIYFLLRESGIEMCKLAAENMIAVSLLGLVAVGSALIPVSGLVVKPLIDNHRKQKQFITAAGHELKTPLTVIRTNAQLLETEIGKSPWLDGILEQTDRLTDMTGNLVLLSRAEEYDNPLIRKNFPFSEVLSEEIRSFEGIAGQKGITVEAPLPTAAEYCGNEAEIRQLIRILMDNACKYCPEGGLLRIQAKYSRRGVSLTVANTSQSLSEDEVKALLQRFRRGRNATGKSGFGLGLSIAQAIAVRHGGRLSISVSREDEFQVEVLLH